MNIYTILTPFLKDVPCQSKAMVMSPGTAIIYSKTVFASTAVCVCMTSIARGKRNKRHRYKLNRGG